MMSDKADPASCQGMGQDIGILPVCVEEFLTGQDRQEFQHALAGKSRLVHVPDARLIGGLLLSPAEVQEGTFGDLVPTTGDGDGRTGVARKNSGSQPQYLSDKSHGACFIKGPVQSGKMAAGYMPDFMGHHTEYLSGMNTPSQKSRCNKKALTARDKGIEVPVPNNMNIKGLVLQSGRGKEWRRICADGIFNFCITDDRGAMGIGRAQKRRQRNGDA